MGGVAMVPNSNVLPAAAVSKLAMLLSGNKAAMADAGVDPNSMGARSDAGQVTMPTAQAAPAVAASPATSAAALAYKPLPTAPAAPVVDMGARNALVATQKQYSKPTDPNDPNAKTRVIDRILGGLVGFGRGYVHDPNAVAEGGAVTNRRYNSAEAMRGKNLDAANTALNEFDQGTSQQDKDYQRQRDVFGDQLKGAEEERRQRSETSLSSERAAKASKYENAIDPNSLRQSEDGKWFGHTYGEPDKEIETAAPKGFKGDAKPKSPAEGLFSDDPAVKKQAEKWFSYEHRDKVGDRPAKDTTKRGTPGQFEQVEKQKGDALKLLEEGDAAKGIIGYKDALKRIQGNAKLDKDTKDKLISNLNAEHEEKKQTVQSQYEDKVRSLGGATGDAAAAAPSKPGADDARVSVISKDGKRGTVPKSQLSKALAQGYKQAGQ